MNIHGYLIRGDWGLSARCTHSERERENPNPKNGGGDRHKGCRPVTLLPCSGGCCTARCEANMPAFIHSFGAAAFTYLGVWARAGVSSLHVSPIAHNYLPVAIHINFTLVFFFFFKKKKRVPILRARDRISYVGFCSRLVSHPVPGYTYESVGPGKETFSRAREAYPALLAQDNV